MKKSIVGLALIMLTITGSTFANNSETTTEKVLANFKKEFSTAKDTRISQTGSNYKVTFTLNEKKVYAYYSEEGQLLGMYRNLVSTELPIALQRDLKADFDGYWINELSEFSSNDGTSYHVTLESAGHKLILKSIDGANWDVINRMKK